MGTLTPYGCGRLAELLPLYTVGLLPNLHFAEILPLGLFYNLLLVGRVKLGNFGVVPKTQLSGPVVYGDPLGNGGYVVNGALGIIRFV
jgi:hypothetical protein